MLSKDFLFSFATSLIFFKIILSVNSCEIDTTLLGPQEPLLLIKQGSYKFKIPVNGRILLGPHESVVLACATEPYGKLVIE